MYSKRCRSKYCDDTGKCCENSGPPRQDWSCQCLKGSLESWTRLTPLRMVYDSRNIAKSIDYDAGGLSRCEVASGKTTHSFPWWPGNASPHYVMPRPSNSIIQHAILPSPSCAIPLSLQTFSHWHFWDTDPAQVPVALVSKGKYNLPSTCYLSYLLQAPCPADALPATDLSWWNNTT